VENEREFTFARDSIKVEHFGPGHTDGDVWVYFEKVDVMALGDTFWNGNYPFIDNEDGGSVNLAIAWANKAIERTTDKTILVPGHGPVGNRAQLIEFRDMLVTVRDKVVALKSQGKSLEDIIAAKPTAAFDDKWGRFCDRFEILHKACVPRTIDSIAAPPSTRGVGGCHGAIQAAVKLTRSLASWNISKEAWPASISTLRRCDGVTHV
jgi:hypothetical protein